MRQKTNGEGTKIAQAAKDLNVTSVTIRRYLAEFNIETTTDENGIKVLPSHSIQELHEVRRLKDEGLTNPKVMEILEGLRNKTAVEGDTNHEQQAESSNKKISKRSTETRSAKKDTKVSTANKHVVDGDPVQLTTGELAGVSGEPSYEQTKEESSQEVTELASEGKSKHLLTCQTCGKQFEHMNPRLRDCLECYRTKRKERRRGNAEKHKNIIQHPLAQQVASKSQQQGPQILPASSILPEGILAPAVVMQRSSIRNYRKAIEETRQITSNLKRRLERPDLSEGERRWLEQVYAYQLILHQGWRHLAEYKSGNPGNQPQQQLSSEG